MNRRTNSGIALVMVLAAYGCAHPGASVEGSADSEAMGTTAESGPATEPMGGMSTGRLSDTGSTGTDTTGTDSAGTDGSGTEGGTSNEPTDTEGSESCPNEICVARLLPGSDHSCALFNDGRAKCWGSNQFGQLGLGDLEDRGDEPGEMGADLPFIDLGDDSIVELAVGPEHTCALLDGGRMKCWGRNAYGELGQNDTDNRGHTPDTLPVHIAPIELPSVPVDISAGGMRSCALFADNRVTCWGGYFEGDLGLTVPHTNFGDEPGEVGPDMPFVGLGDEGVISELTGNLSGTCVRSGPGWLRCWGSNLHRFPHSGGYGWWQDPPQPIGLLALDLDHPNDPLVVSAFSIGEFHMCGRTSEGLRCWGMRDNGCLGAPEAELSGVPPNNLVDFGAAEVEQFVAGLGYSCALFEDGTVGCWGRNDFGVLGQENLEHIGDDPGEMGAALSRVDLGGAALQIAGGFVHACALLEDHTVKCWGNNDYGKLGLGDTVARGDLPGSMGANLPAVELGV